MEDCAGLVPIYKIMQSPSVIQSKTTLHRCTDRHLKIYISLYIFMCVWVCLNVREPEGGGDVGTWCRRQKRMQSNLKHFTGHLTKLSADRSAVKYTAFFCDLESYYQLWQVFIRKCQYFWVYYRVSDQDGNHRELETPVPVLKIPMLPIIQRGGSMHSSRWIPQSLVPAQLRWWT